MLHCVWHVVMPLQVSMWQWKPALAELIATTRTEIPKSKDKDTQKQNNEHGVVTDQVRIELTATLALWILPCRCLEQKMLICGTLHTLLHAKYCTLSKFEPTPTMTKIRILTAVPMATCVKVWKYCIYNSSMRKTAYYKGIDPIRSHAEPDRAKKRNKFPNRTRTSARLCQQHSCYSASLDVHATAKLQLL